MGKDKSAMLKFPIFNARVAIVNDDKTATRTFYSFCQSVWNHLNNTQAKINKPTGGSVVDSEARAAIEQIISSLEKYGITKE